MVEISIERELLDNLHRLDEAKQKKVLDFARDLSRPRGESGKAFIEDDIDVDLDILRVL